MLPRILATGDVALLKLSPELVRAAACKLLSSRSMPVPLAMSLAAKGPNLIQTSSRAHTEESCDASK
jgi:hypothetical protein